MLPHIGHRSLGMSQDQSPSIFPCFREVRPEWPQKPARQSNDEQGAVEPTAGEKNLRWAVGADATPHPIRIQEPDRSKSVFRIADRRAIVPRETRQRFSRQGGLDGTNVCLRDDPP